MKKILVFFGPPGCGKGVQAAIIVEAYGFVHLSTGDVLRDIAKEDSSLGREIRNFIDNGNYIPDEMMIRILKDFIDRHSDSSGFILDGFPRTLSQAEFFDVFMSDIFPNVSLTYMEFDVCEEELVRRLITRAVVEGRLDDKDPQVIQHRLKVFKEKTLPVIERYRTRSNYHIIVGTGKKIPEVFAQVKENFVDCVVHESTS